MMYGRRSLLCSLAATLVVAASPARAAFFARLFAPKAELWERWTRHDPMADANVDHAAWDGFLARYVTPHADGINRIAYGEVAAEDRAALRRYLEALAATPISLLDRDEQRAYWINLYNALTVQVVLDHYPVESIRDIDISPGLFSFGPWERKLVRVEGEALSLNDIEHRILRPIWRDPRLHYAVNCAALGCPNLERRAFTAGNAEALLDAGARAYVGHRRGWRIDTGRLIVSSIYVWFREDFGGAEAGVIRHLGRYSAPARRRLLQGRGRIADHAYDWALNDAKNGV